PPPCGWSWRRSARRWGPTAVGSVRCWGRARNRPAPARPPRRSAPATPSRPAKPRPAGRRCAGAPRFCSAGGSPAASPAPAAVGRAPRPPFLNRYGTAAVVAAVWLALVYHNWPSLHFAIGFDVGSHVDYINYIRTHAVLPLANEGWEMHQPPLYYAASAAALK